MSPWTRRSDDGDTTTTSAAFQAKVAVAALQHDLTLGELASAFGVHPVPNCTGEEVDTDRGARGIPDTARYG